MTGPQRIQQRRTKAWRMPAGALSVARPSRWGNQYRVTTVAEMWRNPSYTTSTELVVWTADRHGHRTGSEWGGFADKADATRFAVDLFRRSLIATGSGPDGALHLQHYLDGLAGHDLACFCPLDAPWCHGNVLIVAANHPDGPLAGLTAAGATS